MLKLKLQYFIWKDPDAGKDWGQEEKGMTEDQMAGWHHQLYGLEFEWTPGVGDGQGGLRFLGSQRVGHNWVTELKLNIYLYIYIYTFVYTCMFLHLCVCIYYTHTCCFQLESMADKYFWSDYMILLQYSGRNWSTICRNERRFLCFCSLEIILIVYMRIIFFFWRKNGR